jgi:hypothetical protein
MRYSDPDLVPADQASQIIADLNRWCRRTGTSYSRFVTAAHVAPSVRSKVRRGLRVTVTVAERIRRTMAENPRGISKATAYTPIKRIAASIVIDRSPCPRCGVRGDIGCKHRPLPEPMQNA